MYRVGTLSFSKHEKTTAEAFAGVFSGSERVEVIRQRFMIDFGAIFDISPDISLILGRKF